MIVRTPDGKWAVYSESLGTLTRVGLDERAALSEISLEMGSIDRARDTLAGADAAWERALALMPAPTRAATLRRYGQTPAPPPAATVRREERKAQAVRAKRVEQEARIKRAAARQERRAAQATERRAYRQTRPRYIPKPTTTPEYQRERHRVNARNSKRTTDAAVSAQIALQRAQRVAVYLLCGTYERTALICKCSPSGVKSALRLAGVEPIAKRRPPVVEVERTMRNFGFGDDDIARAVKILTKK